MSAPRLSTKTLAHAEAALPGYDREQAGIGIVHFGPGAFTRAHQAVYTDDAMARSGGDWGICAVSLNSARAKRALAPQDGLYTLAIRDVARSERVVGAIRRVLFADEDRAEIEDVLAAPATRFVTLTITEKGYAVDGAGRLDLGNAMIRADLDAPDSPTSAMGFIVQAAKRRLSDGADPLTVISCDNLPENGARLRAACSDLAAEMGEPALSRHIRRDMRFPNTMVDSITPATDGAVLDAVEAAIGLRDEAAVQREAFAQWVIEDDLPQHRPDWAGAGAIITADVHAYENTKLRILNGAHSTLTYLGLLAGFASVGEAVADPTLRAFVDALIREETIPTIDAPDGLDLHDYWAATLARFDNPYIEHRLEQISHDGSQKIPARILPVIAHHGERARRAAFVAGAWIDWTRARRLSETPPTDGWLSDNAALLPDPSLPSSEYAAAMLDVRAVFPDDMPRDAVVQAASAIAEHGVLRAIDTLTQTDRAPSP